MEVARAEPGRDDAAGRVRTLEERRELVLARRIDERLDADVVAVLRLREQLVERATWLDVRLTGGEHLVRLVLRCLDVRLVEGMDLEDVAGDGRRELPAVELGAEVVGVVQPELAALAVGARRATRPAPGSGPCPPSRSTRRAAARPRGRTPSCSRRCRSCRGRRASPRPAGGRARAPGFPPRRDMPRPSPRPAPGSARGRRPAARPARSRTSRAPSSGRRSPARPRRRPGSHARVATRSSSEPGSVIATNCAPRPPVCSQKYSRCERVSRVDPDFEETTKSVRSSSRLPSSRRIAAGCVVSRTWNDSTSNARRSTSGARLEPPMPSSTVWSNCSRAPAANAFSSSTCGRIRATTSSQPSQRSSSPPVQTEAS